MKKLLLYAGAFALLSTFNLQPSAAHAQGTAFRYQGQLQDNGSPANGSYNLQFTLFNGGAAAAGPVTNNSVNVTNGLFTVLLDFGPAVFTGQTNWLQIGVASNGVDTFTTLNPLQQLTPVPYAIFANGASNLLGALPATQLSGTIPLAQLPDAVITNNGQTAVTLSNLSLTGGLDLSSAAAVINNNGNSVLYSSSAYYGNFFAGLNAGNPANDSGQGNTANGFGALQDNTTGPNNTANGNKALYNNLSGAYNTANGDAALYNNLSGLANTANGINSLYNNLSGSYNTANGSSALFYSTNGSYNTANGASALFNNNSGNGNTADGSYALYSVVTGTNNIALGYYAGSAFTAGESSNIDIGNPGIAGDGGIIRIGTAGAQTRAYIAGMISGDGAGLTNLNASRLSSGIIPLAQLPLPVVTNAETSVTLSGTFTGTLSGNGSGLTNFNYNNLVNRPVIPSTNGFVTATVTNGLATTNFVTSRGYITSANGGSAALATNLVSGISITNASFINSVFAGDGSGLTSLNTSQLVSRGNNSTTYGNFFLGNAGSTTGGSYNTANGFYALAGNGGGGDNTANGAFALNVNQSGGGNTANGVGALGANTSGNNNTADGYSTLNNNTSGSYNTANGLQALNNNTSGNYNTADGVQSLSSNIGGNNNTAEGYYALVNSTSGSGNIGLGYQAGYYITTGGNNIDIGNMGVASDTNIIRIGTSGTQTATYLAGTVYANGVALTSDRNAKENFTAINPLEVLAKVASLPVTEWNYKAAKNLEHMGPMAQDFHAAFGLNGGDDKHISVVDENGVALAAIQGLNERLQQKETEITELKARLDKLEKMISESTGKH